MIIQIETVNDIDAAMVALSEYDAEQRRLDALEVLDQSVSDFMQANGITDLTGTRIA